MSRNPATILEERNKRQRPQSGPDAVIEVEDLVTHYGDRMILQGVSMEVREKEIMVIMGGSGSGKSTLLRHLMALENKTSGTMRILGYDIDKISRKEFLEVRKKARCCVSIGRIVQLNDGRRQYHAAALRAHGP